MGWFTSDAPKSDPATSQDGTYTPLKRNERKACWDARDTFFQCLDRNNILDSIKDADAAKQKCGPEHDRFEKDCASSWVVYFKQKRVADFDKDQKMKKLEAEGAVPMSEANKKSSWKFW